MKGWCAAAASTVLFSLAISCGGASHEAKVTEETTTIKTYPFGDPDPVPILARARNSAIYPYFRFDGFSGEGRDRQWKVVKLENDYIRVFVLPEAGGKIWGAVEKSTGRDFIYKNDVMKFRDVAMRGPWTSGGIEFNFGLIGHTPATATPVDYVLEQDADGGVSCTVGSEDLPSRTQWRVRIRLPKDSAAFETDSLWYNPTPLQQSYYHWMNAAVHAREDLQFHYPGHFYIGHGGDAHPWPVNEDGIDLSLYRNHHFGGNKSLHVLGSRAEFSGGYWRDLDFGFGHWARYDDMPGRKIWIWSLARSGAIWEDLLTDHSGQYVEVQAGRQLSQATLASGIDTPFTQAGFAPYGQDSWRELWFPVKQTGGMVAAGPDGVLNVTRNGDTTKIAFQALRPVRSEMTVKADSGIVFEESLNLAPMQVYRKEIALPGAKRQIDVALGNRLLWRSGPDWKEAFERPVTSPPEKKSSTAEKSFLLCRQYERMRDYRRALSCYQDCIDADPLDLRARVRLAEIRFRRMEYGEALDEAKKALAVDTYDTSANFVCGAVLRRLGEPASAREALGWAARSPGYRTAAYTMIAEILAAQGDFEGAAEYALRALDADGNSLPALSVLAVAERKLGRSRDAAATQAEILRLDPLDHLAASEAWFLAGTGGGESLSSSIGGELPQEAYLELAAYYRNLGLAQEAVRVLRLSPPHPMVSYWLAYLTRNDSGEESRTRLEKAVDASPRLVFPFREEDEPVLAWALKQKPNWKTRYYLGLLAWSRGRLRTAEERMRECGTEPDFGPFYLARAGLAKQLGQAPAEEDYARARDLAPGEWRTWLALARHYSETGSSRKACETARGGFEKFPGNFVLGMEYARALIDTADYREALDVLSPLTVLPYENASEGRALYEKAHLLLAGENIRAGKFEEALGHIAASREWPEHLGAGKPYDPDERLQDCLQDYCNFRLGRSATAAPRAEIEGLQAELKKTSLWKYELLTSIQR